MQVKIKRLHPDAKMPTYAHDGDACFDMYASSIDATTYTPTFGTGLAFDIPEGYVMLIYSRSGDGFKRGISLVNSVGVIDSGYVGEVMVQFKYTRDIEFPSHAIGDRIAQAMIIPIPKVRFEWADELTKTERGENGFGSSGR